MSTWYEVIGWRNEKIAPVEVEKHTDSSVWIKGVRNARSSRYSSYFPTWEEAHEFLLGVAERGLDTARFQLQRAQGEYDNVKGMKKP